MVLQTYRACVQEILGGGGLAMGEGRGRGWRWPRPLCPSFEQYGIIPSITVARTMAVSVAVRTRWLFAGTIGRTVDGDPVPVT